MFLLLNRGYFLLMNSHDEDCSFFEKNDYHVHLLVTYLAGYN